ncbi:pyridoxal 5'-phosphate synthase glutaminase subunit PdxT [Brotaphodocola catenula]|jgi:5'-phosphate synthase pdxT subunit|uniref:Pyridoxal 5'-phosphate synthase subunit PdxT n=1 Tax=Brotaphodocola catenula TaxID=2885361 RepID=A0AAE3ASF3_9FIRM|nr:pyridoxal 5'-phosphate synthase glutaminase subunit PdxT [Brotaphodocola catenula]MCC2165114.1 pyridoxal 5'-phosphate synthase glutaminase subunit PdxT [Brotaphodocola catenula]
MTVAVLALQGAFAEHEEMLKKLGVEHFQIRQKRDLERPFDALILPGGESTVIGKLLRDEGMFEEIRTRIQDGLPVFGTCAGMILLAEKVEGGVPCLGTMQIQVKRNAYGRQLGSFYTEEVFGEMKEPVPMTFIRAPYVEKVWGNAQALAEVNGHIVAVRQGNQLVTAFHPELNQDVRIHEYFLKLVASVGNIPSNTLSKAG